MAYSHSRLRKTLALVRIATGIALLYAGGYKVSSLEFARSVFPDYLDAGLRGGAADWVQPILAWMLHFGPGRIAVTMGFVELFIGVSLVLGLVVRPACALGMVYMGFLWLSAWNQVPGSVAVLRSGAFDFRNLFPLLLFLTLGIGHAGETWGLGALYHRHRARTLALEKERAPLEVVPEREPASFEEVAEAEARAQGESEQQPFATEPEEPDFAEREP
jgi:uncharacterized membrane protein YphA (DoxX/SURF4 family)